MRLCSPLIPMERSGGNGAGARAGAPSEGAAKGSSLLSAKSTEGATGRFSQSTPRPTGKALGAPGKAAQRTPGGRGRGGQQLSAGRPFSGLGQPATAASGCVPLSAGGTDPSGLAWVRGRVCGGWLESEERVSFFTAVQCKMDFI